MGYKIQIIEKFSNIVNETRFYSDDKRLMICSDKLDNGACLSVFDLERNKLMESYGMNMFRIVSACYIESVGSIIYLGQVEAGDYFLIKLQLSDKREEIIANLGHNVYYHNLTKNNTDKQILILGNSIELYDVESQSILKVADGYDPTKQVFVAFDETRDKYYAYGIEENKLTIHEIKSGKIIGNLSAPAPYGKQLVISASGKFLCVAGERKLGVYLYDLASGNRLLEEMISESTFSNMFNFFENENVLVQVARKGVLGYNIIDKSFLNIGSLESGFVSSVNINSIGSMLVIAQHNGNVSILKKSVS